MLNWLSRPSTKRLGWVKTTLAKSPAADGRAVLALLLLALTSYKLFSLHLTKTPLQKQLFFYEEAGALHMVESQAELERACAKSPDGCPPLSASSHFLLGHPLPINQCNQEELELLPGVGKKLAKRLVRARERHGPFRKAKDLQRVRGIGEKRSRALDKYLSYE